jgi:transposase-like protein
MTKKNRQYTADEKVAILRENLLEKTPISDVCDKHKIRPNIFYRWQKEFFEQGSIVFKSKRSEETQVTRLKQQVAKLEDKLQTKNEVLSELMEEHVMLKKKIGGR